MIPIDPHPPLAAAAQAVNLRRLATGGANDAVLASDAHAVDE